MNHAAPLGMCLLPGMHINVNPSPLPCCRGLVSQQCSAGMNFTEEHVCVVPVHVGRETLCVPGRAELLLFGSFLVRLTLLSVTQHRLLGPSLFPSSSHFNRHPLGFDGWCQCNGKVCFLCLSFPTCGMALYHPLEISYVSCLTHSVNCFEILGWWGDKGKLLQFVLLIR